MVNVLIVGHLTIDNVCNQVTRESHYEVPQGAALGSAVGAAVSGANTTISSVVGIDYPNEVLARLELAGINTDFVRQAELPTLRFWLLRESAERCVDYPQVHTPIPAYTPSADTFEPFQGRHYDAVHLCPMPLRDQIAWARRVRPHAEIISADPQPLRYAQDPETAESQLRSLFSAVDIASLSLEDFSEFGTPIEAIRRLAEIGSNITTLKMGARGSTVIDRANEACLYVSSIGTSVVKDETGAGDAYAGAFVSTYAAVKDLRRAATLATQVACGIISDIGMLHSLDLKSSSEPTSPSVDYLSLSRLSEFASLA